MRFAADGGVVAVEVGVAALEQSGELIGVEHLNVLVRATLAAGVAVLKHRVALALHHLGEAQGLASEGAVAVSGGVLGVEDAD